MRPSGAAAPATRTTPAPPGPIERQRLAGPAAGAARGQPPGPPQLGGLCIHVPRVAARAGRGGFAVRCQPALPRRLGNDVFHLGGTLSAADAFDSDLHAYPLRHLGGVDYTGNRAISKLDFRASVDKSLAAKGASKRWTDRGVAGGQVQGTPGAPWQRSGRRIGSVMLVTFPELGSLHRHQPATMAVVSKEGNRIDWAGHK